MPGSKSSDTRCKDADTLLSLLSCLMFSDKIPLDLLFRGAMSRERWNELGEIEKLDASCVGLDPELGSLLSNMQRLDNAFRSLEQSLAVSKLPDQTYTLCE